MMTVDEQIELGRALTATFEVMGMQCSANAIDLMSEDLCVYTVPEVASALARCRREIKGRLALSDIIDRIPSANPYMPANEAWALALTSNDENETVIWTDEIAAAMGDARPILQVGDKVGARMAFISSYERRVEMSKSQGIMPTWSASLGICPARRQTAIEQALVDGRLSKEYALQALPSPERADELLALPPSEEEKKLRARKSRMVIGELKNILSSETKAERRKEIAQERSIAEQERRSELAMQAMVLWKGKRKA